MKYSDVTEFQKRVYLAVALIPRGYVSTYKLVAQRIHCKSCRAVGQALKLNPFSPKVPCHRVIASDLTIGGFHGKRAGLEIKRKLNMLKKEGVFFKKGKLTDAKQFFRFQSFNKNYRSKGLFLLFPMIRITCKKIAQLFFVMCIFLFALFFLMFKLVIL